MSFYILTNTLFLFQADAYDDDYSSDEEFDASASPETIRRIVAELSEKRKKEALANNDEEPSDILRVMRSLREAMKLPKPLTNGTQQLPTYDEVVDLPEK